MNFLSKGSGAICLAGSRGVQPSSCFPRTPRSRLVVATLGRPDSNDSLNHPATVRVVLCVGLDSRSFRGPRRTRRSLAPTASPQQSAQVRVASQIASTAGPPSLTPPLFFPDEVDGTIADNHSPQVTFPNPSGRVGTGMEHGKAGEGRESLDGLSPSGVWMPEVWGNLVSSGTASNPRVGGAACTRETDPSGTRDILFHDAVWFHAPDRTRTRTIFCFAQAGRHRDGGLGISRHPADLRSRRNRHLEPGQGNHFFYSQCRRLSLYSPQPNAPTMCYGPFPTPQTPNMLTASTLPFVMGSGGEL